MEIYTSIGALVKAFMKCRYKTMKETALAMGIPYTTFSAQLHNNTLSAETLFRLAGYLDMDLNWMMAVLGYYGPICAIDREQIPRMRADFREQEWKKVNQVLLRVIQENPTSTPDARRELLREFGGNMFYLLDVLVPEDYNLYRIADREKVKYYVDIPKETRGTHFISSGRRKPISLLFEGSKALDIVIEERKDAL